MELLVWSYVWNLGWHYLSGTTCMELFVELCVALLKWNLLVWSYVWNLGWHYLSGTTCMELYVWNLVWHYLSGTYLYGAICGTRLLTLLV